MANQRSILIQAAIKAVRVYGMDGVRMQHIGQIAHATPSSIYQYFKGKDELLRVCFEQIDHEIAYIFDKISTMEEEMAVDPRQTLRTVWSAFWRWLADHPDETIFYHNYRDWSGFAEYDMNRDVSHFEPAAAYPPPAVPRPVCRAAGHTVAVCAGGNGYVREICGPGTDSGHAGDGRRGVPAADGRS